MAMMKKSAPRRPTVSRAPSKGEKKLMPKIGPKPTKTVTPRPKTPKKPKMTPQDAAMKKILEGRYGKIYG